MEGSNKSRRQTWNEKNKINCSTKSLRSNPRYGRRYDIAITGKFEDKIQKEKEKEEEN